MLRVSRRKLPLLAAAIGATLPSLGYSQVWNFNNGNAASPWTGTWSVAANWNPSSAFPNGITAAVQFPSTLLTNASGTVTLNGAAITVGRLEFNPIGTALNGNSYTLAGAGSLTVIGGGSIQVQSSGTVSAGVATINSTLVTPANSSITKIGLGALYLGGTNLFGGGSTTEFSGLTVASGSVIAGSAGALNGLKALSTGGDGQLELRGQTVGTVSNPVIVGIGATVQPVNGSIYASTGSTTLNGNIFALQNSSVGVNAGATLTLNGNVFVDGAGTVGNGFTKVGNGLLNVKSLGLNGTFTASAGTTKINAGGGSLGTSVIGGLSATTGLLDITDHSLIIKNSDLTSLQNMIKAGRGPEAAYPDGVADGAWTGTAGLGSSSAKAAFLADGFESRAIGYAQNGQLPLGEFSSFGGVTVTSSDYLAMYTVGGDATLDGFCGDNDVTILAIFYDAGATTGHHWFEADLNYDGLVNDTDVTLIAIYYQGPEAGSPLPFMTTALATSLYGDAFGSAWQAGLDIKSSLVPEPGTLGLIAAGGLSVLGRRRRKN